MKNKIDKTSGFDKYPLHFGTGSKNENTIYQKSNKKYNKKQIDFMVNFAKYYSQ